MCLMPSLTARKSDARGRSVGLGKWSVLRSPFCFGGRSSVHFPAHALCTMSSSSDAYGTAAEARAAMEAARSDVMDCEKEIQSIKMALREAGVATSSGGDGDEGNSFTVTATKVAGLPDGAEPQLTVQLSSPIEEASIVVGGDDAEACSHKFSGVDVSSAMLTMTAADADIPLGTSAPHDVAPLCEFDALKPSKKVTELDVAIVPGDGSAAVAATPAKADKEADEDVDESTEVEATPSGGSDMDKSVYFDASDHDNVEEPRPVVFCGPSGVGKGTLIDMLMKKYPDAFGFSVSHTTRAPREGEVDGVHYNFTTVDDIKKEIDEENFIEYAEVHGRYYGTSIAAVETVQSSGKICILDIDVQGVRSVKKSSLEPLYLFIAPPSMDALEARLRGRATEKEEDILKRLDNAQAELDYGLEEGNFDRVFTNDDLDQTFEDLDAAFRDWYPHLAGSSSSPKKEADAAPIIETPVCTVTLKIEFEPSKKDQKDGLYDLLNQVSKRKAAAIDKLRKSAAAVSRLAAQDSPSKGDDKAGASRAVKPGFLNKEKKEAGFFKRLYERTIGPNSLFMMLAPIAKNYVIFFGTVAFMHFQGQQLALPPPV